MVSNKMNLKGATYLSSELEVNLQQQQEETQNHNKTKI